MFSCIPRTNLEKIYTLVLFLCCVAKYTMNLNLKLLCNAERKEVN